MKLKLLVAAAVTVVLIGVAGLVVPVSIWYDGLQTNSDFEAFLLEYERGIITPSAEADGVSVWLSYPNLARVFTLLSPLERSRVVFPDARPDDADVSIYLSEKAALYLVAAPNDGYRDKVLIYYVNGRKSRCYSLAGYRALDTVTAAVSRDGFSGVNIEKK